MANTGLAQLGSLRLQAQQRSDKVNSNFVTVPEWNQYITSSYKELYDLLITNYGDEYIVAPPYVFQTSGNSQLYNLPDGLTTIDFVSGLPAAAFYKLIGMDLQVTSSPDSWVTLRKFEFTERNKYWLANQYAIYGIITLRYRIVGGKLWLTPVPVPVQTLQMWYVPKPTNLQATIACGTTITSPVITTADTSQLAVGMSVADLILAQGATPVVPVGSTILSIVPSTSFTISANCTATTTNYLLAAWSDVTTLDGISGWEEYVVIDAAIKSNLKEETDITGLMAEKAAMMQRIIDSSSNRDASLPSRVTDTQSIDLGWPGDGSWGGGWGGNW